MSLLNIAKTVDVSLGLVALCVLLSVKCENFVCNAVLPGIQLPMTY